MHAMPSTAATTLPSQNLRLEWTERWLDRAEESLSLSRRMLRDRRQSPSVVCLYAIRAMEDYVKALLVWHQIEFCWTAPLSLLRGRVGAVDSALALLLDAAWQAAPAPETPHDFAGSGRAEPGSFRCTVNEAAGAVALAERVREVVRDAWAEFPAD